MSKLAIEMPKRRGVDVQRPLLPTAAALHPYLALIDDRRWYSNRGRLVQILEQRLSDRFGCPAQAVLSFASGTVALEAAILGHAGWARPDRPLALLPSYTFVATAQAALRAGYTPYIVDVDPATWALDPGALAYHPALGQAGLILPVAAYGRCPDLAAWEVVQETTGVPVVVDAAAAFERFVEAPGRISARVPAVLSFHATKSFTTVEGGAVLLADQAALLRLAQIANFGMDDSRTCRMPGLNGKLSEYHAAVGLACLDEWPARAARYRAVAAAYAEAAANWPGRIVTLPEISSAYVLWEAPDGLAADRAAAALAAVGHVTRRWYGAGLHAQPFFADAQADPLPVTSDLSARHLGLPAAIDLTVEEIADVVAAASEGDSMRRSTVSRGCAGGSRRQDPQPVRLRPGRPPRPTPKAAHSRLRTRLRNNQVSPTPHETLE